MTHAQNDSNDRGALDTTFHVRRAAQGDAKSLGAVVARLTPLLLVAAEYRLGRSLRAHVDPEDLVNDAWLVAFPRLTTLKERHGRITPVLLKFLTTTLNYHINNLLRRHLTGKSAPMEGSTAESRVPSEASGAITRAVRHETQDAVRASLDELGDRDREIILLRGIEQNSSKTVATLLDLTVDAVDKRYSRALKRLRQKLPDSVFAELEDTDSE